MKFSYNWIREFVPGLTQAAAPLERLITMKTAECEGIEEEGALLAIARVARVESVEPIPDSHNVKAVIDAGSLGRKTVVCGAPNCRAGLLTAYAPIGKKVVSGVESDGMLASGAELGINKDHEGIVEAFGRDRRAAAGMRAGCGDRDRQQEHHAPARSVGSSRDGARSGGDSGAAADRSGEARPAAEGRRRRSRYEIEDLALCPRYSALVFENVTVQPSPLWLQYRLTSIGLNPINNIVDMTNFVMAELAQPMHAFDADLLQGDTIFVRPAKAGRAFRGAQ